MDTHSHDYSHYCRPKLGKLLKLIRLDISYQRAAGDYLYYPNTVDNDVEVVDFLGGYGASLFGHNHPVLVEEAIRHYQRQTPFNAQASCRSAAASLAKQLVKQVSHTTMDDYVVHFANTGAEAVETALKHCEFDRHQTLKTLIENVSQTNSKLVVDLRNSNITLDDDFWLTADRLLPDHHHCDFLSVFDAVKQHNLRALSSASVFISLEGGFHGKTSGALGLTHNEEYRLPFSHLGPRVKFVSAGNIGRITDVINDHELHIFEFQLKDNKVKLLECRFANISGMFIEPIQGEGGIRELSKEFVQQCRETADQYGFPIIFDEIQSGMGRTGRFIASEQFDVKGDYYLFGKSLGGGLSKISAVLVRRAIYQEEFGLLHTSTYAEDDFSSTIALKSLALLEKDGLIECCRSAGTYLKQQLLLLQTRYPRVIEEVRGQGLMLGISISDMLDSGSRALMMFSKNGYLLYLLAGYLLHEHRIRVAPTLSNSGTLRIEPSAYISKENCDRLIYALDVMCEILDKCNFHLLTRYILGLEQPLNKPVISNYRKEFERYVRPTETKSVAFIGHFIHSEDLIHWDQSLDLYTSEQRKALMDMIYDMVGPAIYDQYTVDSRTGSRVVFNFIGLCSDSDLMYRHLKQRKLDKIRSLVNDAVEIAAKAGSSVVGFGGYSSIVTGNCRKAKADNIALTTGNSLTVAMGIAALQQVATDNGIDLTDACFGAVGANGNIASVFSQIMAESVPKMVLFGQTDSEHRLQQTADKIYAQTIRAIMLEDSTSNDKSSSAKGIAGVIRSSDTTLAYRINASPLTANDTGLYQKFLSELGQQAPIQISTDLAELTRCNLILGASNMPDAIIYPHHIGSGPVIICDVSVPNDAAPELAKLKNVILIKGGVVKLPANPEFLIHGLPLEKGHVFACMAETLLLGLTGITDNFSYGTINKEQVKLIAGLAELHGFTLARPKLECSF